MSALVCESLEAVRSRWYDSHGLVDDGIQVGIRFVTKQGSLQRGNSVPMSINLLPKALVDLGLAQDEVEHVRDDHGDGIAASHEQNGRIGGELIL